jgi:streptogrisin C
VPTLTNAQQVVGAAACRSGRSSGYDCGTVTKANYSPIVGGLQLHNQWELSFASAGGDSGSPVFQSSKAMGILSGTNGVRSNYGTIGFISSIAGVRPCYTPSCG